MAYTHYQLLIIDNNGGSYQGLTELVLRSSPEGPSLAPGSGGTPYASASPTSSSYEVEEAFDGIESTETNGFITTSAYSYTPVRFTFTEPKTVTQYSVGCYPTAWSNLSFFQGNCLRHWKFQASNNGVDWIDLDERTNETDWTPGEVRNFTIATLTTFPPEETTAAPTTAAPTLPPTTFPPVSDTMPESTKFYLWGTGPKYIKGTTTFNFEWVDQSLPRRQCSGTSHGGPGPFYSDSGVFLNPYYMAFNSSEDPSLFRNPQRLEIFGDDLFAGSGDFDFSFWCLSVRHASYGSTPFAARVSNSSNYTSFYAIDQGSAVAGYSYGFIFEGLSTDGHWWIRWDFPTGVGHLYNNFHSSWFHVRLVKRFDQYSCYLNTTPLTISEIHGTLPTDLSTSGTFAVGAAPMNTATIGDPTPSVGWYRTYGGLDELIYCGDTRPIDEGYDEPVRDRIIATTESPDCGPWIRTSRTAPICPTDAPLTAPPGFAIRSVVPGTSAPAVTPQIPRAKSYCDFKGQIIAGHLID